MKTLSILSRWTRLRIPVAVVASLVAVTTLAHAKYSRTGDATVEFTASGPAGMKIVGTTHELAVSETEKDLLITVPLRNLDTKIELRNKHMREKYLEVDKYPNAELHVPKDALTKEASNKHVAGQLTIHGTTKPTQFTYSSKADGSVTGALHLVITDFGIAQPGYAGVTVKPDVDVNVTFHVTEN